MIKKQHGFGVAEILIIIAVLAAVAVGGWYVWQANQKTTQSAGTSQNSSPTTTTDEYADWKSYCDDITKACFKYPTDWTLTLSGEGDSFSARLVTASNTVAAMYLRNDTRDGAVMAYYPASIQELTVNNAQLKALSGYVPSTNPLPTISVIDASYLSTYPLIAGTESNFVNTARFTQKNGTYGSFKATPIGQVFTAEQAKKWFDSEDAKTSGKIVSSFELK